MYTIRSLSCKFSKWRSSCVLTNQIVRATCHSMTSSQNRGPPIGENRAPSDRRKKQGAEQRRAWGPPDPSSQSGVRPGLGFPHTSHGEGRSDKEDRKRSMDSREYERQQQRDGGRELPRKHRREFRREHGREYKREHWREYPTEHAQTSADSFSNGFHGNHHPASYSNNRGWKPRNNLRRSENDTMFSPGSMKGQAAKDAAGSWEKRAPSKGQYHHHRHDDFRSERRGSGVMKSVHLGHREHRQPTFQRQEGDTENDDNYDALEIIEFEPSDFDGTNAGHGSGALGSVSVNDPDWADTFGTLSDRVEKDFDHVSKVMSDGMTYDDDVPDPRPLLPLVPGNVRGHSVSYYNNKMDSLGKRGKIYEAIQVIEEEMLEKDRLIPSVQCFTTVIRICGEVGYVKKAFQMFKRMKQLHGPGKEDLPVYTSLFKACSLAVDKAEALTRAHSLRDAMLRRDVTPNAIVYRSMIKAFGRCGDLETAFALADEYAAAGFPCHHKFYCMLQQACIEEKDGGLKLTVEILRRMRAKRVRFSLYNYNLFLRAVRDCGLGELDFAQELIKGGPATAGLSAKPLSEQKDTFSWQQDDVSGYLAALHLEQKKEERTALVTTSHAPNLLNPKGKLLEPVSFVGTEVAERRLALFGGYEGVLSHMVADDVTPDLRTFSLLLAMLPPSATVEEEFLQTMVEKYKICPDVAFYNILIRRRTQRLDAEAAKDVLSVMTRNGVEPNGRTFINLAYGCLMKHQGMELLQNLEDLGFAPSLHLYKILMKNSSLDFSYKREILESMERHGLKPDENLVRLVEKQLSAARHLIVKQEKGECRERVNTNDFSNFKVFYHEKSDQTEVEQSEHPYAKFRRPTPELFVDDDAGSLFRKNQAIQSQAFKHTRILHSDPAVQHQYDLQCDRNEKLVLSDKPRQLQTVHGRLSYNLRKGQKLKYLK